MRDRLFMHVTWTTRDRAALIDRRIAAFLAGTIPIIVRQERGRVLALGVVSNHVHLLIRIHTTTQIPRLMQRVKGGSAMVANRDGHATVRRLRWDKGYNIESVSRRALRAVRRYVRGQSQHHPNHAIPGWPPIRVASASSAEPR